MKLLTLSLSLTLSIFSFAQSWQDVGGGTNNSSHGMLTWNGKLINLGSFNNPCNRVAEWDGTSWNCLGGGVGIVARAGVVWDGKLVVVGDFWNVQQPCVGCNGVAVWDGVSWSPLGTGVNNDVLSCTVWNNELVIAGDFTQASGVPCARIIKWNGTAWESVGPIGSFDNDIRAMVEFEGELWVGGDFNNVGGNPPLDGLVKYDPNTGGWVGGNSGVDLIGGVNETVRVLYVNPNDGNLYMGGEFPELWDGDAVAEDYDMSGIAMYDGSNWTPLGTGLNEYCRAMHEYNGDIVAGGYFTNAGGTPANKIAKWNGTTWTAMGQGFDGIGVDEYVKSAAVWNGTFFAGGAYTQAEGGPMNYIAQWYEPPTAAPVAWMTSSSTSLCGSGCIDFLDNSTNAPTSWNWTFPGGDITSSTAQDPGTVCWSSPGTYTVSLQACNSIGCNTQTMDIVVENGATVSVNDASICGGGPETLTAVPSASGGTFLWSPGGETTASIDVNPGSSTTYTVTYSYLGCTSSATSNVTVGVGPNVTVSGGNSICEGQSVTLTATPDVTGGTYLWSPGGSTNQTITVSPTTSTDYTVEYTLNGCSSTPVIESVAVNPSYNETASDNICQGTSYTFGTQTLTAAGTYTEVFNSAQGCDSTVVLTLNVAPTYNETSSATICSGDSYSFGTQNLTSAGTYTELFTSSGGCDSTVLLTLNVNPSYNETASASFCQGNSYVFGTQTLTSGGTYTEVFSTANGCDSTVVLTLTEITAYNETSSASICAGDSYSFGTQTLTSAGTYTELFTSSGGCDSTVVLTLNVNPQYNETASAGICQGDSYSFGTQNLTTAGTYTEVFTSANGCDSTVVLTLSVANTFNETAAASICPGSSYTFGTQTLTSAGTYTESFTSTNGCDSTVTLTLSMSPTYNETAAADFCQGSSYQFGTQTLTSAGTYTENFTSADGCDSLVVLTLSEVTAFNETDAVSICQGDSYSFGTQTLNSAGTYTELFTSTGGCDSTVVLTLSVNPTPDNTITESNEILTAQQAGASYQWIDCDNGNALIAGETGQTFAPTANGSYAVIVDLGGCIDTSDCMAITTIGLDELNASGFTVYPNPTTGEVHIVSEGNIIKAEYQIIDASGRVLLSGELDEEQFIDAQQLSSGTYILLFDKGQKGQVRIVKE